MSKTGFLSQIKIKKHKNLKCCFIFDLQIIRRMICESMLSTKMQKLLQCTVALVNQTALWALCFFFKQTGAQDWHITCRHGCGLLFQFLLFSMIRCMTSWLCLCLISTSSRDESLAATVVCSIPLKNNIKFRILTRS